ncbi:cytochrome ubiquinol oxidase subunit I [Geopsychrobacter electrodiphilus]|uniref:cytochrome ubiquinol oxidase subunit I n=1 Tax=Geopsychrobacter electrodiphilus TaxID=225196 RepID=UPI00037D5B1C|nr:cytochrome ubiquinol oxidase subunit I [Geopsychrobacter electrodiphilus]
MIESLDLSMVNWARGTFALTAMYHWIFVPLTLGLSFLCAFFETIYVRTGNPQWKTLTRFWMTLFGINFAIGVATGIILEFEFGTNWSNYSWMVGDIFGAPLAIEGILAFFLEATFFAVMFFGWNRVSQKFHLFSTWMVAVGSSLSALWILVANGWMQYPIGMSFNPETARFEMQDLWAVISSPVAISHFVHATSSGFLLSSLFVLGISSWYLLKKRHIEFAKRSIAVACVFGLLSSCFVAFTGDEHAYITARTQPMKLAAMEALYDGGLPTGLAVIGLINPEKKPGDHKDAFFYKIEIPGMLTLLAKRSFQGFVPGINDLVYGNPTQGIVGVGEKIARGKQAVANLSAYKRASATGDKPAAEAALSRFDQDQKFLGYGYLNAPEEAVPSVLLTYYAFRIMVMLGMFFILLFVVYIYLMEKNRLEEKTFILKLGVASLFLGWVASQAGWVVSEVGRQPWAIQGLLPVSIARSNLDSGTVMVTFFLFLTLFTALLIAELKIMVKQISIGPEGE